MVRFPETRDGVLYLTEGGQETEIMYRHGHDLPGFAAFPLLDQPAALSDLRRMYTRYLETAERHRFVAVMGGLDYRASPDWGAKLGYSRKEIAGPFTGRLPGVLYAGIVGPRGDAYALNLTMTESEAEDYHAIQMETLGRAGVDLVSAMTFNAVPEAVGVSRAAAGAGLPLAVYFTLDGAGRLPSGPSLREAIERVDAQAGEARPGFYGINCSHPVELEPALEPGDWIRRVRSLRPNAVRMEKVQLCRIGHLEDGDPQELGAQMGALALRHPHLDVWGGCCGTWDAHLDAIASNVRQARKTA
jgi:S-methylmethionine-dependent homocysteine/selenocysteine methylase